MLRQTIAVDLRCTRDTSRRTAIFASTLGSLLGAAVERAPGANIHVAVITNDTFRTEIPPASLAKLAANQALTASNLIGPLALDSFLSSVVASTTAAAASSCSSSASSTSSSASSSSSSKAKPKFKSTKAGSNASSASPPRAERLVLLCLDNVPMIPRKFFKALRCDVQIVVARTYGASSPALIGRITDVRLIKLNSPPQTFTTCTSNPDLCYC